MAELKRTLSALTFEKFSKIKGYSSLTYPFTFQPKVVGPLDVKFIVYFEKL